jgi:hypothetical protein
MNLISLFGRAVIAPVKNAEHEDFYRRFAVVMREVHDFQRDPQTANKPLNRLRGPRAQVIKARYAAILAELGYYRGQLDLQRVYDISNGGPTLDLCANVVATVPRA